jgi:hypothetical protein
MKNFVFVIVALIAISGLSGCVAPPPYIVHNKFDDKNFEPYAKQGTSSIVGQAFLKTMGGEVRFGAGNEVSLTPSIAYTDELVGFISSRGLDETIYIATPIELRHKIQNYIRTTTADGNGQFEFKDIPNGDYYLEVGIYWLAGSSTTGSVVRKKVKLTGAQLKVMLTK